MIINVGVGSSHDKDSFKAGENAAKEALSSIGKADKISFAVVFASSDFNQEEMLRGIRSKIKCPLIGCSTAGEITVNGPTRGSVACMVVSSTRVSMTTCVGYDTNKDSNKSGMSAILQGIQKLGECCKTSTQMVIRKSPSKFIKVSTHSIMILAEGLHGNGVEITKGIVGILGSYFMGVGGSAGDDLKFEKTYQYIDDSVVTNSVVCGILFSDLINGFGIGQGWKPVSPPLLVTKSVGNRIYELDNKPAAEVYGTYLKGEKFTSDKKLGKTFARYSLGIPTIDGGNILRWPLYKENDGSMIVAGDIPDGSIVRVMDGDKTRIIDSAKKAAETALERIGGNRENIACAIIFDCISRRELLGDDAYKEIEAIQSVIGKKVPLIGFYTYGEMSPYEGGPISFYNQTVVIQLLSKTTIESEIVGVMENESYERENHR